MLKKVLITTFSGLICVFVLLGSTAQAAEFNLTGLNVCKRVFACGNTAAYFYGYTNTALISSRISEECLTTRVDIDGVIRAVTHSGQFTYALFNVRNKQYSVLRLNAANGSYSIFDLQADCEIDNESIAADNSGVYVMTLAGNRRGVAGFDFNGSKAFSCSLSNGVAKLFSNGGFAYAVSLSGEIFRLDGSNAVFCANAAYNAQIHDAGNGYIYSDGRLISLEDGSSVYCGTHLAAMGNNGPETSDSGLLMTAADGMIYILSSDCTCTVKAENTDEQRNDSENHRTGSEFRLNAGTTVAQLKSLYPDINTVFDKNGSVVTQGKLRTGFMADSALIVIPGDLDGSGTLSSNDIKLLMRYQIGKAQLSGAYLQAADYNYDGIVDNRDLVMISKNK